MLSGVRDVIGKASEPFERVHSLKVSPEAGIHFRMIQDGLLAIDVNELFQAEGISHKLRGEVLEGLVVLGRDGLTDKGGEARPGPLKELLRELAGDGVLMDRTREQTLSEGAQQTRAIPRTHRGEDVLGIESAIGHQEVAGDAPAPKPLVDSFLARAHARRGFSSG
jgi:hypothetical protein